MNIWQQSAKPIICLAPMDGVADTYFRQTIITAARPDIMFTEFTSTEGLNSIGFQEVIGRLEYNSTEQPLVAQIWGSRPDNFYQAAQLIKQRGFAGVDINMGCPDRAVVKKGGGAALIEQPLLARDIIQATKAGAGGLPVSVKTRIGRQKIETDKWLRQLLAMKIDALIIHARTESELSKVPAHWEEINKAGLIRNQLGLKTMIIGNGDIENRQEGELTAKKYGIDGVMIGRGALNNPWAFEALPHRHSKQERLDLLKYHLELSLKRQDGQNPILTMRKYYKTYLKGFPGAVKAREKLMTVKTPQEVEKILQELGVIKTGFPFGN